MVHFGIGLSVKVALHRVQQYSGKVSLVNSVEGGTMRASKRCPVRRVELSRARKMVRYLIPSASGRIGLVIPALSPAFTPRVIGPGYTGSGTRRITKEPCPDWSHLTASGKRGVTASTSSASDLSASCCLSLKQVPSVSCSVHEPCRDQQHPSNETCPLPAFLSAHMHLTRPFDIRTPPLNFATGENI
jgi:hypothetical protein